MSDTLRIEDGVAWVGDRRMPAVAKVMVHDFAAEPDGRKFVSHIRAFSLPFENGWTVGVGWGGPQWDRPDEFTEEAHAAATLTVTDRDGRVVVWDDHDHAVGKSLDHPGVRHDVPAGQVLALIDQVAEWPTHYLPIMDRV